MKQRTASNSPIVHIPYDQAYEPGFEDMPRRVPALEKLEGLTGFRPATSLNEIVDGVIAYFRDKQEIGLAKTVTAGTAEGERRATIRGLIIRGLIRSQLSRVVRGRDGVTIKPRANETICL